MTILFLIRSLDCGGAERQLTLLARRLSESRHHVSIAVMYSGGVREQDLANSGVRLVDLKKRSQFDMVDVVVRLRRLIAELKPDVVHGYLTAGNLAALVSKISPGRSKVIWAVRDSNMDLKRYGTMTRCASTVAGLLSRMTDGIIANSKAGMEFAVANGYPKDRTIHIANGIDVSKFYPDAQAGKQFRASIGLKGSQKLIGLVARMDPMKDHATFLTAAASVAASRQDTHFVCVGSGSADYERAMKERATSMGLDGRLQWLSSRSDMRGVYSGLDVFCLSSQFGEGFPNVLGEAMACGRNCVATNVGDAAYVAGSCAQIVPPRDPESLASAILADLERSENPEVRERIVQKFSVAQMVTQTEHALTRWAGLPSQHNHEAVVAN
ncbi:MAG TPA: glycosyltransferase [Bryobacteraceae bacterium]|nr:glycosyltransferase [Bryobacteraceae bacterium]